MNTENKEDLVEKKQDDVISEEKPEEKNEFLELLTVSTSTMNVEDLSTHIIKLKELREKSSLVVKLDGQQMKSLIGILKDLSWTGNESLLLVEMCDNLNSLGSADSYTLNLRTIEGLAFLLNKKTGSNYHSAKSFIPIFVPIMSAYKTIQTVNHYIEQLEKGLNEKRIMPPKDLKPNTPK